MVTARATRSTSSPARASSYRRLPSTLRAENIGGVCSISPTKPRNASRTRSSVRPSTGRVSSTRPAESWVSVTCPKRTVASYSFSPSAMNPATLVASPTQMGRTPVAVGSSVPVCPQRFTLNRPFTRRTTSNEVGPLGLFTTTTPELAASAIGLPQRASDLGGDARAHLGLVALDGAARRVPVAAAAESLRDRRHVHVAARAEADPPGAGSVLRLAEGGGDLHAVDRTGVVDEPVGQIDVGPGARHHLAGDGDGGELAPRRDLQGLQHLGEQLHARERLLLVDAHGHLPGIDARLEQLGGDAQAFRIGGGVPEAARVGEDAGVDALRGLARDRMTQALDDLVGEDAHRRRVRIDVVQVAEGLGGDVVIEVEQLPPARRRRHA